MATIIQERNEEKALKAVNRCLFCKGLIKKSPLKEGGFQWRHVFLTDASVCPGAMPDKAGE